MSDLVCQIKYQSSLGGDYYRIGLKTGYPGFIPGQFGMLQVPPTEGILLRRPFSFARQDTDITEILYKVVGKGTEALSRAKEGQSLRLLGPLGRGFAMPEEDGEWAGVAGGYGIAPFLEMAGRLKEREGCFRLFYGARSKSDILFREEFAELGVSLEIATEDGSLGFPGLVTDLLRKYYEDRRPRMVWSCGPMGMLKEVRRWSLKQDIACELSVEEAMGCGTGVCLGCVVESTDGGYLRACKEGPVFKADEVEL